MSDRILPESIEGPAVWKAAELPALPEWCHSLEDAERAELLGLIDGLDERDGEACFRGRPIEETEPADLPLPRLAARVAAIRSQLEHGAGAIRIRRFPSDGMDEAAARLMYWALSVHLGTPVSQSAAGERIFSVRDAGFAQTDPRARGPNTRKRLSFHTDRADVVGFLCLRQAREGGENEVASSVSVYNAIREERPDLLEVLMQPFYYLRHTVDQGNAKPWCRQPVFSFCEGHFACCFLRVLIERAHHSPDLPDLTARQTEALDLVESIAGRPEMHLRFRQESGDLLYMNNWVVLHRRTAFVDHEDPARKRHILRLWLSMPNSRPLDPLFADNFGATAAGAVRGGMRPA